MEPMEVDAVFFDLFDTLVLLEDSEAYYECCLREMHRFLRRNGVDVAFSIFERAYFDIRDRFYSESRESLEEPHFNVRVAQTLQELGYDFKDSDPTVVGATSSFAKEFMCHIQRDQEAVGVLQKLHRNYKLGLISNFSIPECGQKLLEKFGLRDYFDIIVISAQVNQRKPSPRIFKNALQTLGVDAPRAVFVGDMVDLDVMGPQRIGMKTVLITRRPSRKDTPAKPDFVINSLTELLDILEDC
jgi:HAD superfamily hydrolase (TIGR01549 family)